MTDPLFAEWRAYQKLVENDYMGHAQFFQRLLLDIRERLHQPVAILDLGCGDAMPIQSLLRNMRVEHYCGLDQSETALAHAEAQLAISGISYRLLAGDIQESVDQIVGSFDLIIASFSLHHLQDPKSKQAVLHSGRRLLKPGGTFAVIDVFLDDHESREDYLDRFERQARAHYRALNDSEMTTLITHVRGCDYPETVATYQALGLQAGFSRLRTLLRDETSLHQLIALEADQTTTPGDRNHS
jgi:SAM-dependent methyltransferase